MAEYQIPDASRLSHAYIIAAASMRESLHRAGAMAAAAVCAETGSVPCGRCRACRKAFAGIHPDILRVRRMEGSKGQLRREITVDQVRQIGADAYVLPNEADRKVYIVEDADTMNVPAQNAALKLLEEPPRGVILLLCVTNPAQLLPTVRSRCVEIDLNSGEEEADRADRELAREFLGRVAAGDRLDLCAWCVKNEGMDNRAATRFLEAAGNLTAEMICGREEAQGLSLPALLRLRALTDRCLDYLRVNTGVKQIFGLLAVDAIDSSGNRG